MHTRTKAFTAALVVGFLVALAAGSATVTYQARVKNAAGTDINGPVTAGFRIYGSLSGTTVLWGETQGLVAARGIISVELGKVHPLPASLFQNPELYLGITVAGDPEMTPRTRMLSTWKAMSASRASGKKVQAGGATLTVSGTASASVPVTFPSPFSAPPVVTVGAPQSAVGGVNYIPTRVSDLSTTGCVVHFSALDGATATGSTGFDWIAIGE